MSAEERSRPGTNRTAQQDAANVSMSTIVTPASVSFVVRIALDPEGFNRGRRLCLDDLPPRSHLDLDVTACHYPAPEAVRQILAAAYRGVCVEIAASDAAATRAWHEALGRVA